MDKTKVLSGFSGASTAEEVIHGIDLTGKIVLVTGGYAGIGLETTRVLHAAGARVLVPARDVRKAEAALQGLQNVEIESMDLADPASIDTFAKKFLASGRPLHIMVNSAVSSWGHRFKRPIPFLPSRWTPMDGIRSRSANGRQVPLGSIHMRSTPKQPNGFGC